MKFNGAVACNPHKNKKIKKEVAPSSFMSVSRAVNIDAPSRSPAFLIEVIE